MITIAGHIHHSATVMCVITWNPSFRGLLNVDDSKDDFDSEKHETHATVLDKLLAWEKKLYDEVKVLRKLHCFCFYFSFNVIGNGVRNCYVTFAFTL